MSTKKKMSETWWQQRAGAYRNSAGGGADGAAMSRTLEVVYSLEEKTADLQAADFEINMHKDRLAELEKATTTPPAPQTGGREEADA